MIPLMECVFVVEKNPDKGCNKEYPYRVIAEGELLCRNVKEANMLAESFQEMMDDHIADLEKDNE